VLDAGYKSDEENHMDPDEQRDARGRVEIARRPARERTFFSCNGNLTAFFEQVGGGRGWRGGRAIRASLR